MAGMGPPPKPGAIRRNQSTFDWVLLPREGRTDDPPELPSWRSWHAATIEAWRSWWKTPQATKWDPSGRSLWRWAYLFDRMVTDPDAPVTVHTQMTALEDRHGFSEKAMLNLRWRLAPDEVGEKRAENAAAASSAAAVKRASKATSKQVAGRLSAVT